MMGVDISVELPEGDAGRGQALVEGALGCAACHTLADVGSPWAATDGLPALGPRAAIRIQQRSCLAERQANMPHQLIGLYHSTPTQQTGGHAPFFGPDHARGVPD